MPNANMGLQNFKIVAIRVKVFVKMKKQFLDLLDFITLRTHKKLLKKMSKKLDEVIRIVKSECKLKDSDIKNMIKSYSEEFKKSKLKKDKEN